MAAASLSWCTSALPPGLWRRTWLKAAVSVRAPSCHVWLHSGGFLFHKHTPWGITINSPLKSDTHNLTVPARLCVSASALTHSDKARGGRKMGNFNNFICEKLQAKFINRHFYLKRRRMVRIACKRKVVHMPETCSILTLEARQGAAIRRKRCVHFHTRNIMWAFHKGKQWHIS